MQCSNCQTPLMEEDQFCPACGQPVVRQLTAAPPESMQSAERGRDQIPHWMMIGGGLLLVVLCFGTLAVGGFFFFNDKNQAGIPAADSEVASLQATVAAQEAAVAGENAAQAQPAQQQESVLINFGEQPIAEVPGIKVWIDKSLVGEYHAGLAEDFGALVLETKNPTGTITITPVEHFSAALPESDEIFNVEDLSQSIVAPDMEAFSICLPVPGGSCDYPDLNPNVDILDFQNGRGIRAVSIWTDDTIAFSNERLDYYFYGLTADKQFYIAAGYELDHSFLDGKDWVFKLNDSSVDVDTVDAAAESVIEVLSQPSGYTPELSSIDAVIRSLRVEN